MEIKRDVDLRPFTSMYVGGRARYFPSVNSSAELLQANKFAKENDLKIFILGGGSNIIVSDSGFNGLVVKISILGREQIRETDDDVDYEVGAGENWDKFVEFSVESNLYGIENMSHVPGTVGASVVQNIGCYGQEVSDSVQSVKVIDRVSFEEAVFVNNNIGFSYRRSRFNDSNNDKDRFIITSVIFRLRKNGILNLKYDDLKKYFLNHQGILPTLKSVRQAVIETRNKKFPFPDSPQNGTVGSFWNAEVVDEKTYQTIILKLISLGFEKKAEEMESKKSVFRVKQGYKVVPGLFVEILGLKGKQVGGAKILESHAGIINNFTGQSTARDVIDLSKEVTEVVKREFGVKLKIEPELVGDFD